MVTMTVHHKVEIANLHHFEHDIWMFTWTDESDNTQRVDFSSHCCLDYICKKLALNGWEPVLKDSEVNYIFKRITTVIV